jgi:RNA polymerase sigma factor (sigma-70 family)
MDDSELLREYAMLGSEPAFTELVKRHVNLVYSAARRQVDNPHLAEEVTQKVFILLARKARRVYHDRVVSGWLYQTTRYVASECRRIEVRRYRREQEAMNQATENDAQRTWEGIAPFLDEAMASLGETDRRAVLLRFFENKSYREIGTLLDVSDDTAQKRVTRAIEKLRGLLTRRGTEVSGSLLAACLSGFSVQSAPVGLAASVASNALLSLASASAATLTLETLKLMTVTHLKSAAIAGLAVLTATGTIVYQASQNRALRRTQEELSRQATEWQSQYTNEAQLALSQRFELERLKKESADIFKLRAEVARLRQELARLNALNQRSNTQRPSEATVTSTPIEVTQIVEQLEQKQQTIRKMNYLKSWGLAFIMHANDHNDQFADGFEAASSYIDPQKMSDFAASGLDTSGFELVFHGPLLTDKSLNYSQTIMVREKAPLRSLDGKYAKSYLFMDGHVEVIRRDAPEQYADWEQQRMPSSTSAARPSSAR